MRRVVWALALGGDAAFLVLTFGWGTVRSIRRTGRSGWVRPASDVDALGEAVCTLGCLATLAAPVLALTGVVRPIRWGPPLVEGVAGLGLLVAGTAVALVAQRAMGTAWKAGIDPADRPALLTTGPFAATRNPFYLGCMLVSAGVAVAVPSVVAAAGLVAVVAAANIVVRWVEEPFLRRVHGEAYRAYTRRTGRFLPGR